LWLLAILGVAVVIAIPLLVRARRRRGWGADLAASEDDVAWFARALVPELRHAGSAERVAGGWTVGSADRIRALEDRLTVLEASAPDDTGRFRARALRDAVRSSRERMEELVGSGFAQDPLRVLDSVAADLEAALRAPYPIG
jgi:hypothetical protein